ncbi:MAG: heavy-metal-associated domain-containing protein [Salinivenus sp.]
MRDHPRFLFLLGIVLLIGVPVAQGQSEEGTVDAPDAVVHVDGLACPFCAYGLEKKLNDLDGIESMEVQVEESRILVAFQKGQRASEEDLRTAVEDAGFSAREIEFPKEESGPSA